eukprot:3217945-Rhodomonas_salina.1
MQGPKLRSRGCRTPFKLPESDGQYRHLVGEPRSSASVCSRSETKAVGAERHGGGSEVGLGVVCAGMSSPVPQSPLMGG